MARRQAKNNFEGKGFKGFERADKVGKIKAPGTYPFDRRYGSSITRTVIEKYDLDSNWAKWRRGYEYYNQAAWLRFQVENFEGTLVDAQLDSELYQGAVPDASAIKVTYDGYKFATLKADSGNHYVIKRTVKSSPNMGTIEKVENDQFDYADQFKRREIRVRVTNASPLLLRMIADRITDGETSATVNYILNDYKHPALYRGKSHPLVPAQTVVNVPTDQLLACDLVQQAGGRERDLQLLVGELGYVEQFFAIRPIDDITIRSYEAVSRAGDPNAKVSYVDTEAYFAVDAQMSLVDERFEILDQSGDLPPSMLDIAELPKIFETDDATVSLEGTFVYQKELYQWLFGRQYLTADLVAQEVNNCSFKVMPFTILYVEPQGATTKIVSVPFVSELELYAFTGNQGWISFDDQSFTKIKAEPDGHGADTDWRLLDTDVDPWMESVFTSRRPLTPDTLYTCSCPAYGKSILRMPETTENREQRRTNRQLNYPLPTVLGKERFEGLGVNSAAGIIESWETRAEARHFKMCKHTVAAMFIEHLKVKEPSQYPSIETRLAFEEKLKADIAEVQDRFYLSLERGEITTTEIIFALAQGLNLDDVELAYVLLQSKF